MAHVINQRPPNLGFSAARIDSGRIANGPVSIHIQKETGSSFRATNIASTATQSCFQPIQIPITRNSHFQSKSR